MPACAPRPSACPSSISSAHCPTLGDADTLLVHLLQFGGEPAAYPAGSFPPVHVRAFVAMSFRGLHQQPPLGVLLIDAAEVDGSCRDAAAIMHRMGPALARVAQLESLNERVGRGHHATATCSPPS
jgi:hypothetical protein